MTEASRTDWSALKVYARDPLGRLIHDRLGIVSARTFYWIATIVQVLDIVVLVTVALVSGKDLHSLYDEASLRTTLAVICYVVFALGVSPVAWTFYVWFNRAPTILLSELSSLSIVHDVTPQADAEAFRGAERLFHFRRWPIASAAITAGMTAVVIVMHAWKPPSLFIALPVWAVGWYMICMVASREIATILTLHLFFRRGRLTVNPVHPDGCGGLGALNRFAVRFTYLLAACGVGLILLAYIYAAAKSGYFIDIVLASAALYLVLAPVLFFATLGAAHGRMKESKQQLLEEIARRIQGGYDLVGAALRTGKEPPYDRVREIEELRALYDLAQRCPVWPFDARSLQQFAGGVLLPPVASGLVKWGADVLLFSKPFSKP